MFFLKTFTSLRPSRKLKHPKQIKSFHHNKPLVTVISFSWVAFPNSFHLRDKNEKCVNPYIPATAKYFPSRSIAVYLIF